MIGFPLNPRFVSVVLFISMGCVESQDFCQSYQQNNYSLIVYSQSNDTILLIVDKHFWRLRENDTELVFDRQDFEASNSSEQWSKSNYLFAHPVYDLKDKNFRGMALFKDRKSTQYDKKRGTWNRYFSLNFYEFYGNYFKDIDLNAQYLDGLSVDRFVFTIFDKQLNVEIQQNRVNGSDYQYRHLNRNSSVDFDSFFKNRTVEDTNNLQISAQMKKLTEFEANISIIGSYLNSEKEIILFLRRENGIKYCALNQCIKEEFKTLISCGKPQSDIWVILVIGVVSVGVLIIIGVLMCCCLWYYLSGQTRVEPKTVSELHLSSVPTVDSVNGQPLNRSENDKFVELQSISMSEKSSVSDHSIQEQNPTPEPPKTKPPQTNPVPKTVVTSSPVKQQKPTTHPKGKGKMKPKKSPQLKK